MPSDSELQDSEYQRDPKKRNRSPSYGRSSISGEDIKRVKMESSDLAKVKLKKCEDDGDEQVYQKRIRLDI